MRLYKYLTKKHLLDFKEQGIVKVNTLQTLQLCEDEGIGDKLEGYNKIQVPKDSPEIIISGNQFRKIIPSLKLDKERGKNVSIILEGGVEFTTQIDAYIFCTTMKRNDSLWAKLGYDSHYAIINPNMFSEVLDNKLNELSITVGCEKRMVSYMDKTTSLTEENKKRVLNKELNNFLAICFTKNKEFFKQAEYRFVFVPRFRSKLEPKLLICPELRKYCLFR